MCDLIYCQNNSGVIFKMNNIGQNNPDEDDISPHGVSGDHRKPTEDQPAEILPKDFIAPSITGLKVSYYHICRAKLWLFSHNIQMEQENEYVQAGREIHEDRYSREKKDVLIDDSICIDYIRGSGEDGSGIVLHEIKKSSSMTDAHRHQMMYYLYYLKKRGVNAVGELNYPLTGKTEKIILTEEDEIRMKDDLNEIDRIIRGNMIPPEKMKICPKCAYYYFCFGD